MVEAHIGGEWQPAEDVSGPGLELRSSRSVAHHALQKSAKPRTTAGEEEEGDECRSSVSSHRAIPSMSACTPGDGEGMWVRVDVVVCSSKSRSSYCKELGTRKAACTLWNVAGQTRQKAL